MEDSSRCRSEDFKGGAGDGCVQGEEVAAEGETLGGGIGGVGVDVGGPGEVSVAIGLEEFAGGRNITEGEAGRDAGDDDAASKSNFSIEPGSAFDNQGAAGLQIILRVDGGSGEEGDGFDGGAGVGGVETDERRSKGETLSCSKGA